MFRQLLSNKKIVIPSIAVLFALVVIIAILVTPNTEEAGGKDTDTKTEQSKENADSQDDQDETDANKQGNGGSGLEVLEPDQVTPDNSSDASGSWKDATASNTQTGNTNTTEQESQTGNQTPDEDKTNNDEVLENDISWGQIY